MPGRRLPNTRVLESELIGAALRYAALADWFEARPYARNRLDEEERAAVEAFDRIEAELRTAGRRLLRRLGHREVVLQRVLAETLEC